MLKKFTSLVWYPEIQGKILTLIEQHGKGGMYMSQDEIEQQTTEDMFREGLEQLDRGKNVKALKNLLLVIEEDLENVVALNKAGVAYARLGEVEGAEKCFVRAIIANPQYVPALSNLGNIYMDRGDYDRAIALYKKALKYDPDYAVAHNNIAAAYKSVGNISKQVEHFKKSQKLRLRGEDESEPGSDPGVDQWTRSRATSETDEAQQEEEETPSAWDELDSGRRRGCLGGLLGIIMIMALALIIV